MKLLMDMNLSPQWQPVMESHGYPSIHWIEIGKPSASDRAIMEWALNNKYSILTHDLDFGAILAATQAEGPSVILLRVQDVLPVTLAPTLLDILDEFRSVIESEALVVVGEGKFRVRILPLMRQ